MNAVGVKGLARTRTSWLSLRNALLLAFLALLSAVVLAQANPFLTIPNRDAGYNLYAGSLILKGRLPYVDFWNTKGPAIYFLNALGLYLGHGLRWGVWAIEYAFLLGSALLLFMLMRREWGAGSAAFGLIVATVGLNTVFTGGNLGTALSERVLSGEKLDATVCELSSYQLESIVSLRCAAATVLNVTPDHLDRYAGVEAYAAAKARLFAAQQPEDFAIANGRDGRAMAMAGASRGDRYEFSFGPPEAGAARDPGGEPGANGSEIWFTRRSRGPERFHVRNRALRGRHNRENAMAAVICARLLGVPGPKVQEGLDRFPGLPHRLELVAERDGVEWVNDSKATNVDSTAVGLAAFPAGVPRVLLIMGGRGKRAPYAPLRPLFPGRVKALLTIGEDAPSIERELGDLSPTERAGTLVAAVRRAAALAQQGDVVLLSPACASYDQFKNYEDRGEAFRRLVGELA